MKASAREALDALTRLGAAGRPRGVSIGSEWLEGRGARLSMRSPIDGEPLADLAMAGDAGRCR